MHEGYDLSKISDVVNWGLTYAHKHHTNISFNTTLKGLLEKLKISR